MNNHDSRRRGNARVDRKALRMAIKFSGFTQAEIARRAGISPQQITNLLNTRQYCTTGTAAKIAKALKTDTEDLFVLNMFGVSRTLSMAA